MYLAQVFLLMKYVMLLRGLIHLKKKARIVEGTRTRVEPDQAELLLKSSELILCIVGLYHLIKGWKGPSSPINFSDVRLIFPA